MTQGPVSSRLYCYKELTTMDDMNEFDSWAQGSRCYEQLKVVVDMNDFES